MRRTERKKIERVTDGTRSWGRIELDHLAIPETVEVTVLGERLVPESFNIYGWPRFTEEATSLFKWREDEIRRWPNSENYSLKAKISYEERIFNVPRRLFDTVEGIEKSLGDLESFNQMLCNRRLFRATGKELKEFVVFGNYWLDKFGQVWTCNTTEGFRKTVPKVITKRKFSLMAEDVIYCFGDYIPEAGSTCPCCGKEFTIKDVAYGRFGVVKGKICHDKCRRKYEHYREIDRLARMIVDIVYDKPQYELLPNGYCHKECCEHIPWLKFHTSDGDIIIGWRKRVISIEWQENFKPFDMAVFNDENVTKWIGDDNIYKAIPKGTTETNVKRGIHAWGSDKAYEYLKKIKELVNPKETEK